MRKERKRFCHILDDIDGVRVVQSQANFVMLEIISDINVKNMALRQFVWVAKTL